jgi:hypothetical protein
MHRPSSIVGADKTRRPILTLLSVLALSLGLLASGPAVAGHNDDIHSPNARKLDREPFQAGEDSHAKGSDLAFQGRLVVAGAYEGVGFFRRVNGGNGLEQISFYDCPGAQGDVSIIGDYVFVSIDSPGSNSKQTQVCNNTGTNSSDSSLGKEGIRIVDISDIRNPHQVAFVETECGSHTHTLIPKGDTTFMYVDSYPIQQTASCNDVNHPEGEFSVLRFPTADPTRARIVSTPDVIPATATDAVGCHDTGVLIRPAKRDLAAAACLGAFAILNIERPANPKVLSVVQNPFMELDHSGGLTWDGKVAIISDEHAGAAGGGGCSPDSDSQVGAMWYYDISRPRHPELKGHFSLPRIPPADSPEELERFRCTTHNWNVLPTRNQSRYVAVSAYYSGGLAAVDFSDPTNPKEYAHYLPQVKGINPDMWSAYWYNGRVHSNEHASQLGLSTFKIDGLGIRNVHFFDHRLNPQTQVVTGLTR